MQTHEPLKLPTRFTGLFGLVLHHQHHGVLLLRSGDRDDGSHFDPSPLLPEVEVNLRFEEGTGD